ncbi:MAG: hypothetical protein AAFO93_03385 [Pseudomonadota bacterium]
MTIADIIGVLGTVFIVAAYFASQVGYMSSQDLAFPVVNLIGACLILYSLMFSWNLPSVLMEGFWIVISIIGIVGHYRRRRQG